MVNSIFFIGPEALYAPLPNPCTTRQPNIEQHYYRLEKIENFQEQPPRQFSKIFVLFSRSNCFIIFQEGLFVLRTDMNFPGGIIEKKKKSFFKEVLSVRRTDLISHRTDTNFPRHSYLVLEHIQIFQEPLCHRTDTHFPGRYPSSNRYFINRSWWPLSNFFKSVLAFKELTW